ncbi:MAG: hypothetical protein LBF97_08115 [Elusimicrobiota bacterium]|jgi:hypothetical protein|nr:hypothetical protein [Elusimicrobiota bacterium]
MSTRKEIEKKLKEMEIIFVEEHTSEYDLGACLKVIKQHNKGYPEDFLLEQIKKFKKEI